MNLLLRLLWVLVRGARGARLAPGAEATLALRVWPTDLDLNGHMNNGRYLSIMDLGRLDLVARMGLLGAFARQGWRPLLGSAQLRFFRSLKPFARYHLRTRVLWWDEKWIYLEQVFEAEGRVAARGRVKGLFRGPGGNVTPAEVLRAAGWSLDRPELPPEVAGWRDLEDAEPRAEPRGGGLTG